MENLALGLPNGSLQAKTLELLEKVGISVTMSGRSSKAVLRGTDLFSHVLFMRPQDIPDMVAHNHITCGICGWDCVVEFRPQLLEADYVDKTLVRVADFSFSRRSSVPARVIAFSRKGGYAPDINRVGIRITTEYPNITKHRFPNAEIVFSHGGTEAKVAAGAFELGVCITETEASIEENGLRIVNELIVSPVVLVSNTLTQEIQALGDMLKGALDAEAVQLVKMNAPNERVRDAIVAALPSLSSPTVNKLAKAGFAIEAVVPKQHLVELFIKLRACGASGWIQHDLNTVVR
ncbi:MAG: ATP phosphoribosyltransferase [Patescibacteria group bacterium]